MSNEFISSIMQENHFPPFILVFSYLLPNSSCHFFPLLLAKFIASFDFSKDPLSLTLTFYLSYDSLLFLRRQQYTTPQITKPKKKGLLMPNIFRPKLLLYIFLLILYVIVFLQIFFL